MTEQEKLAQKQAPELKAKQTGKNPSPNPPLPEAEKAETDPGADSEPPAHEKPAAPAKPAQARDQKPEPEPEPDHAAVLAQKLENQQHQRQHDIHAFLQAMLSGEEYLVPEHEKNDVAVILFKDEFEPRTGLPRFKPVLQFFEGRTAWPNWIGDSERDNAQGFKVLKVLYQPPGSKSVPSRLRYSRDIDFWGQD